MLVFFIHGVATQNHQYADNLQNLIKNQFRSNHQPLPYFYASFWGHILRDVDKLWHSIHQDLDTLQYQYEETDTENILRYQKFREGFFSQFVGDAFTYLNLERGRKIRQLIAEQLSEFISNHPTETDLHLVAHSLGTVILWDILCSDRLEASDPAFEIRRLLSGRENTTSLTNVALSSITTMGSPVSFFNLLGEINPAKVQSFFQQQPKEVIWLNIFHASDILAYPIRPFLNFDTSGNLSVIEKYINDDANQTEKTIRNLANSSFMEKVNQFFGQSKGLIQDAILHAPIVAGAADAHDYYWKSEIVAAWMIENLTKNQVKKEKEEVQHPPENEVAQEVGKETRNQDKDKVDNLFINQAIERLKKVPGMTVNSAPDFNFGDETLLKINLRDGSGSIELKKNFLGIYYVWVHDTDGNRQFAGYVGWLHNEGLKQEVEAIQKDLSEPKN